MKINTNSHGTLGFIPLSNVLHHRQQGKSYGPSNASGMGPISVYTHFLHRNTLGMMMTLTTKASLSHYHCGPFLNRSNCTAV